MIDDVRRWLAAPVFPDSEIQTRRAAVLNYMLLTFLALVALILIGALLGGRTPPFVLVTTALALSVNLVLRAWLRRGQLARASIGLIVVGLSVITADVVSLGTVRAPATSVLVVLVITAGLLFDLGGMIIVTVLCSLTIAGLIGAENAGWLVRPDLAVTVTQWATYTAVFVWTGSLTYATLRLMNRALRRAESELLERQRAEAALYQAHADLERRVEARTVELTAASEQLQQELIEHRRTEEALRESNAYLENLINYANAPVIVWDPHFRITRFNHAFEFLTGRTEAEVIGQSLGILFPPALAENALDLIRKTLTGERWETVELEILHRDQSVRTVLWNSATLFAPDGQTPLATIAQGQDITERKQVEENLRESQLLYHSLVEVSPLSICRKDLAGRFTFANRRFLEASNRSLAGLVGRTDFDLHPPELAEKYRRDDRAVMDSGQVWELVEVRAIQGEEPIVVQTIKAPVYDGAGKINGVQISFWDITDRQRAESEREAALEALRASNAELQTRNEELDAFAHTVAHDLTNPLGVMLGYAELLLDNYGDLSDEIMRQALVELGRSGRKANNIIESLLLLASIRKQDVQAAPLDMAHIVNEVLLRLAEAIQSRGADIHVPDCTGWPVALGYAPWIEEIWVNYLSNALKYGGQCPRIELAAGRQPDGFIRFSVRDDGPGLTPEQQERLFAPFERLGQARVKGHGLGLSVVRRIADKLGGQVGVDSAPGTLRGSIFYFTLPAADL